MQSSQGLLKHLFAEKCCAMITDLLTGKGSQGEQDEEEELLNPATSIKEKQKAHEDTACTEPI